jgi:hypothetical protein
MLRRQKIRRLAWVAVGSLITVLAFGGGYLWRHLRDKGADVEATAERASPQQRAQALDLLDRAVAARHGELTNEAVRLAIDARRLNPVAPGAALFLAETSLRQRDYVNADAAAREALRHPQYHAGANIILALGEWMRRGERGTEAAGATSTQLLLEAAESELASGAVRFLAGDLLRAIGRPAEAHANSVASLYRQQGWNSAAVLTAKLWLALEEAGPLAKSGAALAVGREGEIFGASAVQLQRAIREKRDLSLAIMALQSVFTAKQLAYLSSDSALETGTSAKTHPSGEQLTPPFGNLTKFSGKRRDHVGRAWERQEPRMGNWRFQVPDGATGKH